MIPPPSAPAPTPPPPRLPPPAPPGRGDDPPPIGSGPTVPDPTTLADARAVLDRRRPAMEALGLTLPSSIGAALADPANQTPQPGDPALGSAEYRIIATPAAALAAAAALARRWGYEVIDLG